MTTSRRAFVSLLLGAAGAPLVPWRGLREPRIFLPARPQRVLARVTFAPFLDDASVAELRKIISQATRLPEEWLFESPRGLSELDETILTRYVDRVNLELTVS
jgi:hypothetical protein